MAHLSGRPNSAFGLRWDDCPIRLYRFLSDPDCGCHYGSTMQAIGQTIEKPQETKGHYYNLPLNLLLVMTKKKNISSAISSGKNFESK